MDHSIQPIGIFDSGIGGLTVARAVHQLLPNENIIYFGDTARVPYGDKSAETIQNYSREIVDFLLAKQCKLILIACNSASAAAYIPLKNHLAEVVPLLCVIEPVIEHLGVNYVGKNVGLIGTKQTVYSQVFAKKIAALNKNIQFYALATPLLVPVIEEGFHHKPLIHDVLEDYLSRPILGNIDALILGCTHYPLIKDAIQKFYQHGVDLIDSSLITANKLKKYLMDHQLLNERSSKGEITCYLSDLTEASVKSAEMFFSGEIECQYATL